MNRFLAMGLLLCSLSGCHAAKPLVAPTSDYGDYKAIRVAENLDERLALTWDYLKRRPDGWYAERLRRYFDRAEPVFYKVRRQNVAGLEAYLRALPDGPHADEAVARVTALRIKKNREAVQADVLGEATARIEARKRRRARAARELQDWVISMLDPAIWDGRALSSAPGDFLVRYQLALPQPICAPPEDDTVQRCFKSLEHGFRITGQGKVGERSVAFAVEAELDDRGRPLRLRLRGFDMFLRSQEAAQNQPLEAARSAGQRAYVARLNDALLKAGRVCNGTSGTDGSGQFDCEGVKLSVAPGGPDADDIIELSPVTDPEQEAP